MSILAARGIAVSFGGVHALRGAGLDVERGQIVGLIGPNGAGKTTFIDAITGFVGCTGGLSLDGRELTGLSPHARVRAGLARTWQSVELFDDLTVAENLEVTAGRGGAWSVFAETFRRPRRTERAVERALEIVGIQDLADADPTTLPHGKLKLVGVARALAGGPRVVCLDEPAAGLDTTESADLGRRLRRIADTGTGVLLVDHDMGLVLSTCDQVVVLEFGEVIAHGTPEEIRDDPAVVAAYLGSSSATSVQIEEAR